MNMSELREKIDGLSNLHPCDTNWGAVRELLREVHRRLPKYAPGDVIPTQTMAQPPFSAWATEQSTPKPPEEPKHDFMTARELSKRLTGSNGLDLAIEKYLRLLVGSWRTLDITAFLVFTGAGTCGLCAQHARPSGLGCFSCPLEQAGESCSSTGSLWTNMRREFRGHNFVDARRYAEQLLKVLLELKYGKDTKREG